MISGIIFTFIIYWKIPLSILILGIITGVLSLYSYHKQGNINPILMKVLKPLKLFYFWLVILIVFLIVGAVLREIASSIIHYIGVNVTGNASYEYNLRVVWSTDLKIVAYVIYTNVYLIIITFLFTRFFMYRDTNNASKVNKILVIVFILCSPTLTTWPVEYTCGGWGGNCIRYLDIVTPIIMSINPINILLSGIIYYFLIKLIYFRLLIKINELKEI